MLLRAFHVGVCILLISLISCNTPARPTTARPGLGAAIVAQAAPLPNLAASEIAPTAPVTSSPGTQVSVTSASNCRSGPGRNYALIFTALPGQSFQVVGKYMTDEYWVINNPAGGTCWLWGQHAVLSGDTAALAIYSAPTEPAQPTASPVAGGTPPVLTQVAPVTPNPPGNLRQTRTCSDGFRGTTPIWIEAITLTWQDSSHESGYRIYKNGNPISTLPQNSHAYQIELRYDQATAGALYDNFAVEAYNKDGASQRPSVAVARCP